MSIFTGCTYIDVLAYKTYDILFRFPPVTNDEEGHDESKFGKCLEQVIATPFTLR
jgi:hypothetical protein